MTAKRGSDSAQYNVGYRKPPIATRFEKGKSGNPKGRPTTSDLTPARLAQKLLKTHLKSESGKNTKYTVQDSKMVQLAQRALHDVQAARLLLMLAYPRIKKRSHVPISLVRDVHELSAGLEARLWTPDTKKGGSLQKVQQEYKETIRLFALEESIRSRIKHIDIPNGGQDE